MKIVLVSAVALIDVEGRILLAQRPEGKSMAGLWEFPGGKVEPERRPRPHWSVNCTKSSASRHGTAAIAPLTFASHSYPGFHLLMPLSHAANGTASRNRRKGRRWPGCVHGICATTPMPPADEPLIPILRDWV